MKLTMVCVVWGWKYTRLFRDYTLRTLLASGNIPYWSKNKQKNILKIYCPREDWLMLKRSPAKLQLEDYVTIQWIRINPPPARHNPHPTVVPYHKEVIQECIDNDSSVMFLCPDIVLSNNVFKEIKKQMGAGKEVVVCNGLRILKNNDELLTRHDGEITTGFAVDYWVRNMHPISAGCFINAQDFTNLPSNLFYQKSKKIISGRCCHQHPLFIKHPRPHNGNNMIDGPYMNEYRDIMDKIHVVDNSKMVLLSFTPEMSNHFYRKGVIKPRERRMADINRFVSNQLPVHKMLYNKEITFRGYSFTDKDMGKVVQVSEDALLPEDLGLV